MPKIRAANLEDHRIQTRADIVGAAAKLFYRDGYDTTTLGAVADLVGIGRTTLYDYFDSKEELLLAVIEDQAPRHVERILDGLPPDDDPVMWAIELFSRSLHQAAAHDDLSRLVFDDGFRLPVALAADVATHMRTVRKRLRQVLVIGIESGEVVDADVDLLVRLVVGTLRDALGEVARSPEPMTRCHELVETWAPLLERALRRR